MKVILSRKGFDSERGGYASPILPDGRLLSLPIPSMPDSHCYADLAFDEDKTYYDLMWELKPEGLIEYKAFGDECFKRHKLELTTECHLDPDIYYGVIERHRDWRPLFGQSGTAQGHLGKEKVKEKDVFLFFGTFRETIKTSGKLSFDSSGKERHIIFGYFQIGEIVTVSSARNIPEWMLYHSHASGLHSSEDNTIYVAEETLSWNDYLPGAGAFSFTNSLVLTKEGYSRSRWQLPECFNGIGISYHDQNSWKDDYFQSRPRGQEFVVQENDKIEEWTKELINMNASGVNG